MSTSATQNYQLQGPNPFATLIQIDAQKTMSVQLHKWAKPQVVPLARVREIGLKSHVGTPALFLNYTDDGGQAKTQKITIDPYDPETVRFARELRTHYVPQARWVNEFREKARNTETGAITLPLAIRIKILFHESHMPRWGLILLLAMLCPLVLPIPFFLYAVFGGTYRLTVDAQGLTCKGFFAKHAAWSEIEKVDAQRLIIQYRAYGAKAGTKNYVRFAVHVQGQKPIAILLEAIAAGVFMTELVERKKLERQWVDGLVC